MRVKLKKQHFIDGTLHEVDEELDVRAVTPEMEGLDEEARAAIKYENLRVFGRYPWPPGLYPPGYGGVPPLDDPPIPRPIDNNRPEYHFVGAKEYSS